MTVSISPVLEARGTSSKSPSTMGSESQLVNEHPGGGAREGGGGVDGGGGGRIEVSRDENTNLTTQLSEFDLKTLLSTMKSMNETMVQQGQMIKKFEQERKKEVVPPNQTVDAVEKSKKKKQLKKKRRLSKAAVAEKSPNFALTVERQELFKECARLRDQVFTYDIPPEGKLKCPFFQYTGGIDFVNSCSNSHDYTRIGKLIEHMRKKHNGIWAQKTPTSIQFGYLSGVVEKALGTDRESVDAYMALQHFQGSFVPENVEQNGDLDNQQMVERGEEADVNLGPQAKPTNKSSQDVPTNKRSLKKKRSNKKKVAVAEKNLASQSECREAGSTGLAAPEGGEDGPAEQEEVEEVDELTSIKVEVVPLSAPRRKDIPPEDFVVLEGDAVPELTAEQWREKCERMEKKVIKYESRGDKRKKKDSVISLKREGGIVKKERLSKVPTAEKPIDKYAQVSQYKHLYNYLTESQNLKRIETVATMNTNKTADPLVVHLQKHAPGLVFSRETVTNGDCW